jgi:hypothetical protein
MDYITRTGRVAAIELRMHLIDVMTLTLTGARRTSIPCRLSTPKARNTKIVCFGINGSSDADMRCMGLARFMFIHRSHFPSGCVAVVRLGDSGSLDDMRFIISTHYSRTNPCSIVATRLTCPLHEFILCRAQLVLCRGLRAAVLLQMRDHRS